MSLRPVGFVPLFTEFWIIILYSQRECDIHNRNSTPNFKLKVQEQASDE